MGEYFPSHPFGTPALDDELAHDPGNSAHWSLPHPGYALPGSVDAAVYQPAQLEYPESSQRTMVPPNPYLFYCQVRASQPSVSLSAPQQLHREAFELGQGYYPATYDYPAFTSLTGTSTYESADAAARDEGMQIPQLLPSA
jgi:hypothetical protein